MTEPNSNDVISGISFYVRFFLTSFFIIFIAACSENNNYKVEKNGIVQSGRFENNKSPNSNKSHNQCEDLKRDLAVVYCAELGYSIVDPEKSDRSVQAMRLALSNYQVPCGEWKDWPRVSSVASRSALGKIMQSVQKHGDTSIPYSDSDILKMCRESINNYWETEYDKLIEYQSHRPDEETQNIYYVANTGSCNMGECSWFKHITKEEISRRNNEVLFKVSMIGGTSKIDDIIRTDQNKESKIDWDKDKHNIYVFCSKRNPSVFDDKFPNYPDTIDFVNGPSRVTEASATLYWLICHGSLRGWMNGDSLVGYESPKSNSIRLSNEMEIFNLR